MRKIALLAAFAAMIFTANTASATSVLFSVSGPSFTAPASPTVPGPTPYAELEVIWRAIGVSTADLELVKTFNKHGDVDAVQIDYSILNRTPEEAILAYCKDNGIGVPKELHTRIFQPEVRAENAMAHNAAMEMLKNQFTLMETTIQERA